ncbi:MAG: S9 family peptidase, partial [Candidatus Saccharimonas sp.]|nr:S9 family peptidase [Planctomycetaceae bacterium]
GPSFRASIYPWLERGGIYAVSILRGGSEYGEDWHKAGMLLQKQNVFDDSIAVAEHLIAKGWTRKSRLVASGGSNGGLLVGALSHTGTDQQSAVASSLNGQLLGASVLVLDQPLGSGDEVVEDVLLFELRPRLVPVLAVLAPAAQVRDREDAAHLQPCNAGDRKTGRQRNREASVGVEQRRVRAVEFRGLLPRDEHRHLRAILAGVEDLLDEVVVGIELHLGLSQQRAVTRQQIEAEDRRRRREAGERIKGLRVIPLAAETRGRADAGERNLTHEFAVDGVQLDLRLRILQIRQDELVADKVRVDERLDGLRDHLAHRRRFADVDRDDPLPRRFEVRHEIKHRPVVADERVLIVKILDQVDRHPVRFGQVFVEDSILVVGPLPDADDQVASVLGDFQPETPRRFVGPLVDEHVLGLSRSNAVIEDFLVEVRFLKGRTRRRFVVAAVEEALAVHRPSGSAELDPLQFIGQQTTGLDLDDPPCVPVGPGIGHAVGDIAPVVAERCRAESHCAVLRPCIGIDQHGRLGVQGIQLVEDRLILQPVVLDVEIAPPRLERRAVLLVVPQFREPRLDRLALRDRGEVRERLLVFGGHPLGDVLRFSNVLFEPTVGVGHLHAMQFVHMVNLLRRRIGHAISCGQHTCTDEKHGDLPGIDSHGGMASSAGSINGTGRTRKANPAGDGNQMRSEWPLPTQNPTTQLGRCIRAACSRVV